MHPRSDEEADRGAMVRLADGQDIALNAIMERWQDRLAAFLLRLTGDREAAVSLAQETFVRLYRHRRRYNPRRAFSTWIFSIARNLARNHLRWRARHPETLMEPADLAEVSPSASGDDPRSRAESRERLRAVEEAIRRLPPEQREALVLSVYEGLGHSEIAEITDATPKAVEVRLWRARRELRESLGEHL
jgi:RNA polymerase sigma-70 factor (ECF subfamily)